MADVTQECLPSVKYTSYMELVAIYGCDPIQSDVEILQVLLEHYNYLKVANAQLRHQFAFILKRTKNGFAKEDNDFFFLTAYCSFAGMYTAEEFNLLKTMQSHYDSFITLNYDLRRCLVIEVGYKDFKYNTFKSIDEDYRHYVVD